MYSLCGICCVKRFGGTDQRSGGVCRESGNDFVCRFINSIKSEQGKSNYYVEEGVENILITDEEQVILAKQSLSELAILENMSDQYKFQSLDLNLYENGMYTYTYIYNDQLNPDHPLHIDAAKREKNAQITIFGQSEHMVLPSLEADFYTV